MCTRRDTKELCASSVVALNAERCERFISALSEALDVESRPLVGVLRMDSYHFP